ncbi:MAG: hypothetical protein PWR17_1195 [Candidatus Methanomethylophilaceae archaeon]|nr:hypothetical protein [Candidatus Methanomethylophilaceae archaeon]
MARVSVVIPVYNESGSIGRVSRALGAQDFEGMEVIFVVDSKTTDDSLEKIRETTDILDGHRVIIQKGIGVLGEARNLGLDAASGDYVWFLDADDVPYPDFMRTMFGLAEEHKADVCQCNFVRSTDVDHKEPEWDARVTVTTGKEALRLRAYEMVPVTAWSMLLRRGFLKDNGLRFIEGSYAEDIDFTYRVLEKCGTYCYCDKPMYLYFQNPSSICFTKQNVRGACEVEVYTDLHRHFARGDGGFGKEFGRRSALMRVRSAAHMDMGHFMTYVKSGECREMMKKELSDPPSPEYIWLSIWPSSYYTAINIFLKFFYYRNGRIFGRRLGKI